MQTTDATPLRLARDTVTDRLASAPGVVCALDFDGTLAPIVDDPAAAEMPPPVRERVADLADCATVDVAIVSGRELGDLRARVSVEGIDYAGNHGLELRSDDREVVNDRARRCGDAIDRVCDRLADRLAHVPGVEIENKGLSATVHVRQVPTDRVAEVKRTVRATVGELTATANAALELRDGKAIREIRPAVDWDKGRAVELLADEAPDDWLPLYVGDDRTDEDAFRTLDESGPLDGVGVLVGDRETAADYRLGGPRGIRELLGLVERAQCE